MGRAGAVAGGRIEYISPVMQIYLLIPQRDRSRTPHAMEHVRELEALLAYAAPLVSLLQAINTDQRERERVLYVSTLCLDLSRYHCRCHPFRSIVLLPLPPSHAVADLELIKGG